MARLRRYTARLIFFGPPAILRPVTRQGEIIFFCLAFGPGVGIFLQAVHRDWGVGRVSWVTKLSLLVAWPILRPFLQRAESPGEGASAGLFLARLAVNVLGCFLLAVCGWDLGWALTAKSAWVQAGKDVQARQVAALNADADTLSRAGDSMIAFLPQLNDSVAVIKGSAQAYRMQALALQGVGTP